MPFPFMTLRLPKSLVALTFIGLPVLLAAQEASSSEEERLQRLMTDAAEWYVPKHRVSLGFRMLTSGGKVTFGNLGNVPFELTVPAISEGATVDRVYNNGAVAADAARANEKVDDVVTSTPGGRYITNGTKTVNVLDGNGNPVLNPDGTNVTQDIVVQTGDFLAYTPGQTRSWAYASPSQVSADGTHVAFSTYSATSDGASVFKDSDASAGVEFQYVRTLSKSTSRLQWGMLAGVTLNGINSKTAGSVTATLHTRTDYYSMLGATVPTAPYSGPSFDDYTASTGDVFLDGLETTVPIAAVPDQHTEGSTVGGVNVDGNWQVKGAYFMLRFGPTIRTQLTNRIGVYASLGVAGAYAGTIYSVAERFLVPNVADVYVGNSSGVQESRANKFLSGYYADLNVEWAASERTGLFTGVTAQKFDGYDQEVGGRTARIDLGSSVGLRGGVSIRF